MLGRPVLLSIAAAVGTLISVGSASAGCFSCGCAPVVYSYTYASPCAAYAAPPMYVINQGPAYTLPVPLAAEATPAYPYVGRRVHYGATAYYGEEADYGYAAPRMYRHWRHYHGLGLYRGWRHHGRPHIGMRRFWGERYRRFAHGPRVGMRMHMHMQRHLRHAPMRALAPGYVHPRKPF